MNSLKTTYLILTGAIAAAAVACNTTGCLDNQSSIPLAACYSSATDESITLNTISIHGVGAPGDSVLVHAGQAVSEIYLPMRSTQSSTSWCFHYATPELEAPENNDTVTFAYTSEPFFASEECGAMYRYRITAVRNTFHLMDSVVVTDSLITNEDRVRIRLYFRTAEEPDQPDTEPDTEQ